MRSGRTPLYQASGSAAMARSGFSGWGCGTGARVAVTADYLERARTGRSSGDRDVGRRRGAVRGKWWKPARVSPDPISPFAHAGVRGRRTCTRVTCSNAVLQGAGDKAATLDTSTDQRQSMRLDVMILCPRRGGSRMGTRFGFSRCAAAGRFGEGFDGVVGEGEVEAGLVGALVVDLELQGVVELALETFG